MFYSHEGTFLTSRKYGVATVWLVATLGAKSNLRKINRKAILDVNVPKACETILTPEAPMALRLQSNLLYGVSRVYSEQCTYVLTDAQNTQSTMRTFLKIVRHAELDPNAGKSRPDQLVLQDDPAFLPDFFLPNLDIDLSTFGTSTQDSSGRSSILSAHSHRSSQSSNKPEEESLLGLIIPTSASGNTGEFGGFELAGSEDNSAQRTSRVGDLFIDEEAVFYPDVDFNFDAEGNLVDLSAEQEVAGADSELTLPRLDVDPAVTARVRREHQKAREAGQQENADMMDIDILLPDLQADNALPEGQPFPEMGPQTTPQQARSKSSSETLDDEESAEAPMTRIRRGPRVLPMDKTQELRGAQLLQWNNDYLRNMVTASHHKLQLKLPSQARKNAAVWVFGSGIGGVGIGIGSSKLRSPLDMFAGDKLMETLTGVEVSAAGKKRSRSDEDDHSSESEERRFRPRSDKGEQIGRGEDLVLEDSDILPQLDDTNIEIGREAMPLLEDHSSQMPWNISASVHGSRQGSYQGSRQASVARGHGYLSTIGGFPSAGGPSSLGQLPFMPDPLDRRASRLTSASPLAGRGPPRSRLGSLELPTTREDENDDLLRLSDNEESNEDFQLYGPAAAVDTQTAAQSQWLKATLDQESTNFLAFVQAEINATATAAAAAGEEGEDSANELAAAADEPDLSTNSVVVFQNMLPPTQHTKIVAAQAFHHVLVLATKGLVSVNQNVGFGPIHLGIIAAVA